MHFTTAKILVHHDQIVFFSLIYDALDHLSNVAVAMDETVKTEGDGSKERRIRPTWPHLVGGRHSCPFKGLGHYLEEAFQHLAVQVLVVGDKNAEIWWQLRETRVFT